MGFLMDIRYLLMRLSGSACFVLAIVLTGLLDRGESFAPFIFAGLSLVSLSVEWKKLGVGGTMVVVKAEKDIVLGMRILLIASLLLLSTAVFGTSFHTRFSVLYALPLLMGIILALVGILTWTFGVAFWANS